MKKFFFTIPLLFIFYAANVQAIYRNDMHNGLMGNWGFGGLFGFFISLAFWIILIAGIILLIGYIIKQSNSDNLPKMNKVNDNALRILRERFAKGEISEKEYDKRKKKLSEE